MRHRFPVPVLATLALGLATLAPPARATQIVLQTVEQMTYRADVVVRAIPTGEKPVSRWTNPDGTGLIVTTTTLRVLESIAGGVAAGQTIAVEHLGGTVGDLSMAVPGMSIFRAGEEVVLFAKRGDQGQYHVLDLSMGKFEVANDGKGATLTRRDLEDAQVVGERPESPTTLAALKTSVSRAATRKAELLKSGKPLPDGASAHDAIDEGGR